MYFTDQRELTTLLKDSINILGDTAVRNLLPEPFTLGGGNHDTGCQFHIDLWAKDTPTINVWTGSIWYHSRYDFNDRDKILGFDPEVSFAHDAVSKFFNDLRDAYEKGKIAKKEREQRYLEQQKASRDAAIEKFKLQLRN